MEKRKKNNKGKNTVISTPALIEIMSVIDLSLYE